MNGGAGGCRLLMASGGLKPAKKKAAASLQSLLSSQFLTLQVKLRARWGPLLPFQIETIGRTWQEVAMLGSTAPMAQQRR